MKNYKKELEDAKISLTLLRQEVKKQIKMRRQRKSLSFILGLACGLIFGVVGTFLMMM